MSRSDPHDVDGVTDDVGGGAYGLGVLWAWGYPRTQRTGGAIMRKRPHWFALVLWAFAIVFLVVDVPLAVDIRRMIMSTPYPGGVHEAAVLSWWNIWNETRSAVSSALQISALGALIEIADRIRLNTAQRSGPPL